MSYRPLICQCCGVWVAEAWHSAKYCERCSAHIKTLRQRFFTRGYQAARRLFDPDYLPQHREAERQRRLDPDYRERGRQACRDWRKRQAAG